MSNVPKLRFKEFDGEWNVKKLSSFATKVNTKNKDESITEVFTNSAVNGIVAQRDFFDKDIANQNNLGGYYIVQKNDFIYNPRISSSAPVGPLNRNYLNTGVMSPLYTVFSIDSETINLNYLERYFKTSKWYKYMYSVANYGARSDRMAITNNDFFSIPIPVPSKQEQEKIASFLTSVDTKIQLLTKKKELLSSYKKGVMQKIFSGEIRFSPKGTSSQAQGDADDGSEFSPWEEMKLGDLVDKNFIEMSRGSVISKKDINDIPGKYPIYSSSVKNEGLFGHYGNYMFDEELITWSVDGGGHFFYRPKHKFSITNVSGYIRILNNELNYKYLSLQLQYLHQRIAFDYQTKAHPSVITKLYNLKVPCVGEQTKIANFLSSIDSKCEQVQKQLDSTKEFKKALLQQMFV